MHRVLTDRPWTRWHETPSFSGPPRAMPAPTIGTLPDRVRARMLESARLRAVWCAEHPNDGETHCLRAVVDLPDDEALEHLRRPDVTWCGCEASEALLVRLGERAFVSLLALERKNAAWKNRALDLIEPIASPWALPIVLAALTRNHSHDTNDSGSRHRRRRARRWLRRTGQDVRDLLEAIAIGTEVPELEAIWPPPRDAEEGTDLDPSRSFQARMALGVLGGSPNGAPLLLPLRFRRSGMNVGPIEVQGRALSEDERETFFGWLLRIDWSVPNHPVAEFAASLDDRSRSSIAEALRTGWLTHFESDLWVLFGAIAFGGPSVAEELAHFEQWPKDTFAMRRTFRESAFPRAVGAIAAASAPDVRDRLLVILGALALDPTKKRAHVSYSALAELEAVAIELDLPPDMLDERFLPSLGLGSDGARRIAWGTREVVVKLDTDLSVVMLENGVRLASPPTTRKGDDRKVVDAAKKELAALRTEAKRVQGGIVARCETWMRTAQRWAPSDFTAWVVQHSILGAVAQGFLWGLYRDRALVQTFRVAEDRTFADVRDVPVILPSDALVGPVHAAELDGDEKRAWQTLFGEYEIIPLVPQLDLVVLELTDAQKASHEITHTLSRSLSEYMLKEIERPRNWRTIGTNEILGERHDGIQRMVTQYEQSVRDFRVRIVATGTQLLARVRRFGDYECHWLPWGDAGPVVAHEVLTAFATFEAAL